MEKQNFSRIGVYSQLARDSNIETLQKLLQYLDNKGKKVLLSLDTAQLLKTDRYEVADSDENFGKESDLIITVGGDGNLLRAARLAMADNVPLIGINRGRVGFLTDISPDKLSQKLNEIFGGNYIEEKRVVLTVRCDEFPKIKSKCHCIAINEVLFASSSMARMIEYEIRVDGEFLCKQRANGVLTATPTGSTAYALSSGGPILNASLEAFALVPICPHHLNNRPIIISSEHEVTIQLENSNKTEALVYGDSYLCFQIKPGESINIKKIPTPLYLIHPKDYNYFDTLRSKLKWG